MLQLNGISGNGSRLLAVSESREQLEAKIAEIKVQVEVWQKSLTNSCYDFALDSLFTKFTISEVLYLI